MNVRRTKIVATLGPASSSPEVLEQLILAGMDVARLNFSHGSPAEHKARAVLVREIAAKGEGSGLGAAGGAVVGGLLGHQVGGGRGQDIATVVGAVGGAVAGNEVEKRVKATKSYDISVRLDNGSTRVINEDNPPSWRSGDRVKIVDGAIRAP